ncbi:MAG: DUF4465 domain-containing protein [Bacteroidales bacterium]|nr:DUF4465 domain-containing protein [Bacteroidales bacterium]
MRKVYLFCSIFLATQVALAQEINFEDLSLNPNSYWNGSDNSGGFTSGNIATFPNTFTDWGGGITSWSGFAYSNMLDTITQSFTNEFSCYAGIQTPNSTIFGLSYNSIDWMTGQTLPNNVYFSQPVKIQSIDVTNSTYAALTMLNGDAYSKKFGGASGNDPDWFKLTIIGSKDSIVTGSIEFYLADYRFANNSLDYIVKDWATVDLSSLGIIDMLSFVLNSSDTGMYGMNTPAYFCFDNIKYDLPSNIANYQDFQLKIFPNPAHDYLNFNTTVDAVYIIDLSGRTIKHIQNSASIALQDLEKGIYIIELNVSNKTIRKFFEKL